MKGVRAEIAITLTMGELLRFDHTGKITQIVVLLGRLMSIIVFVLDIYVECL